MHITYYLIHIAYATAYMCGSEGSIQGDNEVKLQTKQVCHDVCRLRQSNATCLSYRYRDREGDGVRVRKREGTDEMG